MKKILLGAVLVSSLAMSGDVAKCSQAMEKQLEYIELALEQKRLANSASNEEKKDVYTVRKKAYFAVIMEWNKQGQKGCRGILSKEQIKLIFGAPERAKSGWGRIWEWIVDVFYTI